MIYKQHIKCLLTLNPVFNSELSEKLNMCWLCFQNTHYMLAFIYKNQERC